MRGKDVLVVSIFLLFVFLGLASCASSCMGPRRSSTSSVDYSERAQELGTSTKEYSDAYNYWKYQNP